MQKQQQNGKGSNRRNGPPKQVKKVNMNPANQQSKGPKDQIFKAPIAQGAVTKARKPRMITKSNGDVTIIHREFIRDVPGSGGFQAIGRLINPGRKNLFPWLSNIAPNYESYIFKRLEFDFQTSSSTTATGRVILAIDYDAIDNVPASKTEVMSWRNSVSCSAWEFMTHKSLTEDLTKQKTYFVRTNNADSNATLRTSDVGTIYVCTQGQSASGPIIGELYVDYEVKLMTPQLNKQGIGSAVSAVYQGNDNSAPFALFNRGDNTIISTPQSSGTTTSRTEFHFAQDWEGMISIAITGTGFPSAMSAIGGTATAQVVSQCADSPSTHFISLIRIDAKAGDDLVYFLINTTVSNCVAYFFQGEAYA